MDTDNPIIHPVDIYWDDENDLDADAIAPAFNGPICAEECPKDLKFNGGNPVVLCEKYRVILGFSTNVFFNRCERCIEKHGK